MKGARTHTQNVDVGVETVILREIRHPQRTHNGGHRRKSESVGVFVRVRSPARKECVSMYTLSKYCRVALEDGLVVGARWSRRRGLLSVIYPESRRPRISFSFYASRHVLCANMNSYSAGPLQSACRLESLPELLPYNFTTWESRPVLLLRDAVQMPSVAGAILL